MSVHVELPVTDIRTRPDGQRWTDNWTTGDLEYQRDIGGYIQRCRLTCRTVDDKIAVQFTGYRAEVVALLRQALDLLDPQPPAAEEA